jgi:hypothetical protein
VQNICRCCVFMYALLVRHSWIESSTNFCHQNSAIRGHIRLLCLFPVLALSPSPTSFLTFLVFKFSYLSSLVNIMYVRLSREWCVHYLSVASMLLTSSCLPCFLFSQIHRSTTSRPICDLFWGFIFGKDGNWRKRRFLGSHSLLFCYFIFA